MIDLQIEIFILIGIGYILSKKGYMSTQTRKQLTNIVLSLVLPCAIIQSFEMDLTRELIVSTGLVFLISVAIQFLYWLFNRFLWKKESEDRRINCQYGTMVSNAGFMGMPFAQGVFGNVGLLYASIFLIPQRVCMWSYGLSLYAKGEKENVLKKVLLHPCIIAIYLGILVMILRTYGIYLPTCIDNTIAAIASCNTAFSMIVIGGILSEVSYQEIFDKTTWIYSLIRLIVLPLVIIGILRLLSVDLLVSNVCILLSAMPAASTTAMLAEKYDRDPRFASKLIFVSTLGSLITLPFIQLLIQLV